MRRSRPVEAVTAAGELPIVLTRAGRERPAIAGTVDAFIRVVRDHGRRLSLVEVPNGRHGFDYLDHGAESRGAVRQAMDAVVTTLTSNPGRPGDRLTASYIEDRRRIR